ncbi:MAG: hypothetical protein QF681_19100, partial [Vicinamibacterales bacterium]|nr:hypothetical protein [Vicinamibacterales bacterium]
MSNSYLDPVDETSRVASARSPVTDDSVRAVRVLIDAYRLSAESRDKRRVDSELLVARQVMEELVPSTIPTLEGLDIGGVIEASLEVGGDYFE